MPKVLFYASTVFCFFLALASGGEALGEWLDKGGALNPLSIAPYESWGIATLLLSGLAIAALFLRMAALLAARNLFAAFVALVSVTASALSLAALLYMRWRMVSMSGRDALLNEIHFGALLLLGFFISLSFLALRPYFSIQASRFLSALVFFPLPLFIMIVVEEFLHWTGSPAGSPTARVFFAVLAILFVSIGVHSIRHRHLFLEMTNLRELLDSRVDPASLHGRPIGGVAFHS